jgi:hypothetical protein
LVLVLSYLGFQGFGVCDMTVWYGDFGGMQNLLNVSGFISVQFRRFIFLQWLLLVFDVTWLYHHAFRDNRTIVKGRLICYLQSAALCLLLCFILFV